MEHKVNETAQKGFAQVLLIALLVAGLAIGVYLVQKTQIFRSRAGSNPIIFIKADGSRCDPSSSSCTTPTTTIKVELTSTLGPPATSSPSASINTKTDGAVMGTSTCLTISGLQKALGSIKGKGPNYDSAYDANNDGQINISDFSILKSVLSQSCLQTTTSNEVTQSIQLQAGWNPIGIMVDKGTYRADDLLNDLDSQTQPNSRVTQISRMVNGGAQEVHTKGQQANNFDIKPGEGYLVRATKVAQATIKGSQANVTSISIPQGYTYLSLPTIPANLSTAEKFLQVMKTQGVNVNTISIYQNGNWQQHLINFSANDFNIEPGKAYLVKNTGSAKDFTIAEGPTATPLPASTPKTAFYRIAEDPTDLDNTTWQPYRSEPTITDYTFKVSTPGQRFIWVEFKDYGNKTDRRSAQITLQSQPVATPTPTVPARRVFITSTTYNGNLGGVAGADAKCQERASTANLGGVWRAWISDSNSPATTRLEHSTFPYKLISGVAIADNWADLIDESLKSNINVTETGAILNSQYKSVWTGTTTSGTASTTNCINWTNSSSQFGKRGNYTKNNSDWTLEPYDYYCNGVAPLYCIEQPSNTTSITPSTIPSPTPAISLPPIISNACSDKRDVCFENTSATVNIMLGDYVIGSSYNEWAWTKVAFKIKNLRKNDFKIIELNPAIFDITGKMGLEPYKATLFDVGSTDINVLIPKNNFPYGQFSKRIELKVSNSANPNDPNKNYSDYMNLTVNYTNNPNTTPTPTPIPQVISVSTNNVIVTIKKIPSTDGRNYGGGFTITTTKPIFWIQDRALNPVGTYAQGFAEEHGDVSPSSPMYVRTYVSTSTPKGTYTGSEKLWYQYAAGTPWIEGPTVNYTINVTD